MKGILESNPILNGSLDLRSSREEILEALKEAVEYKSRESAEVLIYPFGFIRLAFVDNPYQSGFVFHIWLSSLHRELYPHSHIFDMESRLLKGRVTNFVWHITPDENGTHKLIQPMYQDNTNTYKELDGRYTVKLGEEKIVSVNQVYALAKGIFHSSSIDKADEPVVTLVKKSNIRKGDHPINVIAEDAHIDETYDLASVSQDEAWETIISVVNKL